MIEWELVESSNIVAVAYDEEGRIPNRTAGSAGFGKMFVAFKRSREDVEVYVYEGVAEFVYNTVKTAESVGRAVNQLLRNRTSESIGIHEVPGSKEVVRGA